MKKNLICVLLALVMVLGLMVISAPDAYATEETTAHTHHCYCINAAEGAVPETHVCEESATWEALTTSTVPVDGGHYYLTTETANGNFGKLTSSSAKKNVTICLNGNVLKAQQVIKVQNGNTVTICDCKGGGQIRSTQQNGTGFAVHAGYNKAVVNLYSGQISGYIVSGVYGRPVIVDGGTFNMYGGSIINGDSGTLTTAGITSNGYGGNVYITSYQGSSTHVGTFNLYGGTIQNGKATVNGGNIYVKGGALNVYGGTIQNGSAVNGGNIATNGDYIKDDQSAKRKADLTISGGIIQNGVATGNGGNIYMLNTTNGTVLSVKENAQILNGSAVNGGNIYQDKGNPSTISGGTISGGIASADGGNIYLTKEMTISGGVIENGTATNDGGNLYISAGSVATISGGSFVGGTAKNGGSICAKNAVELNGVSISGGTATSNGGNIWSEKTVTIGEGTVISDGNATSNGGNIYVNGTGSKLDMKAGKIENGTAGNTGGNIYTLNSPNVLISNAQIIGGTAASHGGNLYVTHTTLVGTRKLTISDAVITGGNAEGGNGGNLYISRVGQVTLTDVTVTDGVATESGSNVYIQLSHIVNISGGTYSVAAGNRNYTYDAEKHTKYTQEEIETYGLNNAGTRITGNGGNICISSCSSITTDIKDDAGNVTGSEITEGSAAITGAAIIGGNAVNGGALYVGNANVTLDGITAKSCGGGSGRALHVAKNAVVTVKDSTLINWGTVGTAIVNQGTLKLVGTVNIPKEYNASERLNQANGTAPSVTLDLLVDTTENENAVIDISDLTEVDEAITVNRYGGEVAADGTKHTQVGLVATGANETNAALITCAHACYTFELDGTQIYLVALAVQGMNGTDVVSGYASLAEIDENDGATWYILNSDLEGQTVSKSILLDLNGNALTAEISEGVVVSVIDSANDKYDASACGKLTVSGSGTVETIVHTTAKNGGAVKHYVLLKNEDGSYSAHRYVAAVVAVSLDPNNDALGYKASFSADEAARAAVTGYGFNLWVEDGAVKTYTKDSSFVKLGSTLTLRLKNILAAGGGEMTINGNAFINFNIDGQIVSATTSDKSTSMKEVIETVDAAVAEDVNAYTEAQMTAVQNLVNQYESSLTDWSISNIKAWTVPTEDTTGDSITTEDGETTDQGTNA